MSVYELLGYFQAISDGSSKLISLILQILEWREPIHFSCVNGKLLIIPSFGAGPVKDVLGIFRNTG